MFVNWVGGSGGTALTPPEEIRKLADKVRAEGADTVAEWLEETAEEREEGEV